MLRSLAILMLIAGLALAAAPAKKEPSAAAVAVMKAAAAPLPPGGKVLPWDRYAVAWLHAANAPAKDLDDARRQAARLIEVSDPDHLVTLSLARLTGSIGKGAWPAFFKDSDLSRALDAGAVDFELFIDLAAMSQGVAALAEKEGLRVELRPDVGLIKLGDKTFEHRIWLTDIPSRMMWTGQPFLSTWLTVLAETRTALTLYGHLRKQLEKFTGGKVDVRGAEYVSEALPPRGAWRYQELVAEGYATDSSMRLFLLQKLPLGGTLIQVPLPAGADPLGQGAKTAQILTRGGSGYQAGYLIEKPEGAVWLTPRMAQDRGWEPEALDERVARDAQRVPLRGSLVNVPGFEGRAVLAIGRYAAALALYPGALRAVVDGPLKKPSRVRAFSGSTHALVVTTPDVPRDQLDKMREAALTAQATMLGAVTPAVGLEVWVDLPLEASGAAAFPMLTQPVTLQAPIPVEKR